MGKVLKQLNVDILRSHDYHASVGTYTITNIMVING